MTTKRILVPVDYSDQARGALEYAGMLGQKMHTGIDVLYVWELMPHPAPELRVQTPDGTSRSLRELVEENAQIEMLDFLTQVSLPQGVQLTERITSGEPSRRILEALRTGDYELVVMGTHGRGGFKHMMMGSVAERLVRNSPVPVLTIRTPGP
jgi:nucleotide-binding universal stress UspA family protein